MVLLSGLQIEMVLSHCYSPEEEEEVVMRVGKLFSSFSILSVYSN